MAAHRLADCTRHHSSLCACRRRPACFACSCLPGAQLPAVLALLTCISAADIGGIAAGMHIMQHRKPLNMKAFSVAHNLFMFWASLYMAIETLRQVIMLTAAGMCLCKEAADVSATWPPPQWLLESA